MAVRRCLHGSIWPLLVILMHVGGHEAARAQPSHPSPESASSRFCGAAPDRPLDVRGLALLYCTTQPALTGGLWGAHRSARPVFYGAVPLAWGGAMLTESPAARAAAYRLTLTQGLTYGVVVGAKHVVGRPRPYVHRPLKARADRHRPPAPGDAHLSFPSGHASLSAALVTSWGLSYPRWYVVGPGALWAAGVALSRVHLGVHYPSDVLVGTVLGTGIALLVHQLRRAVTPAPLRASSDLSFGPPLVLRVTF
ncbi:phosphatase PAP2 family protein [Salinibacter ruber]|uniref:Membrane-associated phospholipid phosphatase n=2 Tax=Salinibacter ruber TaxID=146919 RepID=A0A9X2ZX87_9BACT|nr:phosphatase PAP2 family protein [Salinibacter ruber]MCS3613346.1 membrane-associated phospholipid phosphatase [Salinibacter ruber]MCS3614235.1 membrane-associated phospholipid phosphatase [Salinibacter ruber]MCS3646883.1 membrane-associated phospholipid phosphatase [Salinibacter ruber]MCS3672677.1 membrane-associated phospholipid phosphatase [Salinibacter ruber]MCS3783082.1 membrane-associated phospholipid phosphatase [Salinibacter ruber]